MNVNIICVVGGKMQIYWDNKLSAIKSLLSFPKCHSNFFPSVNFSESVKRYFLSIGICYAIIILVVICIISNCDKLGHAFKDFFFLPNAYTELKSYR